ncbi:MAG TPA: phage tail protein [Pyrinomonadaceae bacterium]|jgi:phage tail-like protein|nr:phage tail protein [Pyrinomonadaceae bacterium]
MATGTRIDPYRNFSFRVEIDGITQAGFSECTGFSANTDPIEYREGGYDKTVRKLPGLTKYSNITLKWGLTDSMELCNWYQDVVKGKIERKSGSIILIDLEGNDKSRWNFFEAWPTKYDPVDLNAKGTDVAIETLELVTEKLERVV